MALNSLPVGPWASGFIALRLSFPLCEMGMMTLRNSWGYSER